jgi:hypothetical protein
MTLPVPITALTLRRLSVFSTFKIVAMAMNENGNGKSQLSTTEPSLLKSLCLSKKGWGLPAISHQVLGTI